MGPSSDEGGVLVIDKPAGMTSHDVVAAVRRALHERRVGHGGTLDPDATGVLVVAVGRATRLLRFVADLDKCYRAEVVLGVTTDTLDASGSVTGRFDMDAVTLEELTEAARALTGPIEQIPPMVSALKVGGRRLYELAREGTEVERAPRPVVVHSFAVEGFVAPGVLDIEVQCGSGTYVRSLAADLGSAVGGGAHLRALRRTRIGPFTAAEALSLEAVGRDAMLTPNALVAHLAAAVVGGALAAAVAHGKVLGLDELGVSGTGPWAVADGEGNLLAVYEPYEDGRVKPILVYRTEAPSAAGLA